ncbi:fibrinogen-like protein 1 [Littorina saxatilis]|uniref:fibrinogen-like protein 1 n=1 Tax=Littorina saxatilis TaxID=31220 RepID=UPI0038B48A80
MTGRSLLQCVMRCSQSDRCSGVTVCPSGETGHVRCQLRSNDTTRAPCLQGQTHNSCHLVYRVKCHMKWGGITFTLLRLASDTTWDDVSWAQAKAGFGDDLSVSPNSDNYFIGLNKLHQITVQGAYANQILSKYGNNLVSAFYKKFTVGTEASNYQLSYERFYDKDFQPALNGLNDSTPLLFAASGNDPNGCAGSRGAPGWYGSDCSGHSMFADPPTWPVPGQGSKEVTWVKFNLVREGPFVDE